MPVATRVMAPTGLASDVVAAGIAGATLRQDEAQRQSAGAVAPLEPDCTLREFMEWAWPVLEPANPFVPGWHLDAIAEHLQAVSKGEIRNLVINIPPRCMKSLAVAVFWPCWVWTFKPSVRWLFSSYGASLSERDSLKCRRLIRSDQYQRRYGDRFSILRDQDAKSKFETSAMGYRVATSVGGVTTGEGADVLVVDDALKAQDADSIAARTAANRWWDETMTSRLNDPRTGVKVIVMQRLHEEDLTGHVLASGGYEHLSLPLEYEAAQDNETGEAIPKHVTALGWSDPRTIDGELLWPERIGPEEVASYRRDMGSYAYAGQYQQRPAPRGGGMFKRSWWQRYSVLPKLKRVELFIDSAFKDGVSADWSVAAAWGSDGLGHYYLIDIWREKVEYPDLMQSLHDVHAKHKGGAHSVPLVIEDRASGQSAIQTLRRPMPTLHGGTLPALPVIPFEVGSESKISRAQGVTPLVEAGCAFVPESAPWLEDFLYEHASFPNGSHDDQVDTTSMALIRLSKPGPQRRI